VCTLLAHWVASRLPSHPGCINVDSVPSCHYDSAVVREKMPVGNRAALWLPPRKSAAVRLSGCQHIQPRHPCPPAAWHPGPLLRVGVNITMNISEREPTFEELLSDPVMVTVLQHARTTAEDMRALLNRARERLAKAAAVEAIDPASEGVR
jgi:hypothetical protein